MESSDQAESSLAVATAESCAFVRVNGRGSHQLSPALKRFCQAMLARGCRDFVIDMHGCDAMDSTFMGVLAGLALRLRRNGGGRVIMINLQPHTAGLLHTLGLDRVVHAYRAAEIAPELTDRLAAMASARRLPTGGKPDPATAARTMLEAHEDLVAIAPENEAQFHDVIEYLKRDLARAGSPPAPADQW